MNDMLEELRTPHRKCSIGVLSNRTEAGLCAEWHRRRSQTYLLHGLLEATTSKCWTTVGASLGKAHEKGAMSRYWDISDGRIGHDAGRCSHSMRLSSL